MLLIHMINIVISCMLFYLGRDPIEKNIISPFSNRNLHNGNVIWCVSLHKHRLFCSFHNQMLFKTRRKLFSYCVSLVTLVFLLSEKFLKFRREVKILILI